MLTALIREDAPGWSIKVQGTKDFQWWQDVQTAARLEIMENRALWSWPVDIYMGAVAQLSDVGLWFWSWKSRRHASLVIHVGENPTWQGGNPWKHPTLVICRCMSTVSMYLLKSVRFPFMFTGELRIWHGGYHCQAGLCSDGEVSAGDTSGRLLSFCRSDMGCISLYNHSFCRSDMGCISLYNKRDFDCLFHITIHVLGISLQKGCLDHFHHCIRFLALGAEWTGHSQPCFWCDEAGSELRPGWWWMEKRYETFKYGYMVKPEKTWWNDRS